mmetsp:Transcript_7042/g.21124  ORF Transcript_7042/g.21124 Transcript_7042/m.21124 type:complete len:205 (+) Transcript_7042:2073-2687(+)
MTSAIARKRRDGRSEAKKEFMQNLALILTGLSGKWDMSLIRNPRMSRCPTQGVPSPPMPSMRAVKEYNRCSALEMAAGDLSPGKPSTLSIILPKKIEAIRMRFRQASPAPDWPSPPLTPTSSSRKASATAQAPMKWTWRHPPSSSSSSQLSSLPLPLAPASPASSSTSVPSSSRLRTPRASSDFDVSSAQPLKSSSTASTTTAP